MTGELEHRILRMARSVQHDPSAPWPAWSTGETLMVALVLNDAARLQASNFTILEALDRVDLSVAQLRTIERSCQMEGAQR